MNNKYTKKIRDKKSRYDFLKTKWLYRSNVLDRIKKSEQNWISILFLLYGAILLFISDKISVLFTYHIEFPLLLLLLPIINLLAFIWCHHSLNLRKQYYSNMSEIIKIERELGQNIPIEWNHTDFKIWRQVTTKPLEGKIVDFILLSCLNFVSELFLIFRLGYIKNSKLVIFISFFSFWPFIYYHFSDKKRLKKIFERFLQYRNY